MKVYKGELPNKVFVINGKKRKQLAPRCDLLNRSEVFAWGDPKPSIEMKAETFKMITNAVTQLAFAILCDYLGTIDGRAEALYQRFKYRIVAKFNPHMGWTLSQDQIDNAIGEILAVETEFAGHRNRVANERPPLLTVTGQTPSGVVKIDEGRDQGDPTVNQPKKR